MAIFSGRSVWWPGCRAGWAGFHRPRGVSFLVAGMGFGGSAGCEGLEAGDRGGDLLGPGPALREAETQAAAAADDAPGAGEDPQPQPSGFPAGAVPVRASIWVQAASSHASVMISYQIWFWA